jgi:hypothetical protein
LRRFVALDRTARPFPDDFFDCFIGFVGDGIAFLAVQQDCCAKMSLTVFVPA